MRDLAMGMQSASSIQLQLRRVKKRAEQGESGNEVCVRAHAGDTWAHVLCDPTYANDGKCLFGTSSPAIWFYTFVPVISYLRGIKS